MNNEKQMKDILRQIGAETVPEDVHALADDTVKAFSRAIELLEGEIGFARRFIEMAGGMLYRFAAGIAVACVILGVWFVSTRTGSIAWADVIKAMAKVDQVHARVIVDSPRSSTNKFFSLEMYYKSPDNWRGQGLDTVQFVNGKKNRVFSIEKKQFLPESDRGLIPAGFTERMNQTGLLNAMLEVFFRGKIPHAEPVINSTIAESAGVEVFDYANDAARMWARIWVLKETQLPLRVRMHQPDDEETTLVLFDYTAQQTDEFFDPDAFMEQAEKVRDGEARHYYRIGKSMAIADPRKPEQAKPMNPEQIHKVRPITTPEFKNIEQSDTGVLMISAIDPQNIDKNGRPILGQYREELRDNWGNIYLRVMERTKYGKDNRVMYMYYIPAEPFIQGQGEHTIKLTYTTWGYTEKGVGYDKVLSEDQVPVPEERVKGIPDNWHGGRGLTDPFWKIQAYRIFAFNGGIGIADQWDYVNQQLMESPDSQQLLEWKLQLVEELEGTDAYFEFFAENLLDKKLEAPFPSVMHSHALPKYMLQLYNTQRYEEFDQLVKKFNTNWNELLSQKEDRRPEGSISRWKAYEEPFPLVLQIPEVTDKLDDKDMPKVLSVAVGSDGKALVEFEFPMDSDGKFDPRWDTAWIVNTDTGQRKFSLYYNQTDSRVLYLFEAKGDKLNLAFLLKLDNCFEKTHHMGSTPWSWLQVHIPLEVQLPAPVEKTSEELLAENEIFQQHKKTENERTESERVTQQGHFFYRQKQYEKALAAYQQAVSLIKEKLNAPDLSDTDRKAARERLWSNQSSIAYCMIQTGRIDDAEKLLAGFPEQFANNVFFIEYGQASLRSKRLDIVEYLIKEGRLDEAEVLLDKIGKAKPDFRQLEAMYVVRELPHGGITSSPERNWVYNSWKSYDKAVWKLRKARTR